MEDVLPAERYKESLNLKPFFKPVIYGQRVKLFKTKLGEVNFEEYNLFSSLIYLIPNFKRDKFQSTIYVYPTCQSDDVTNALRDENASVANGVEIIEDTENENACRGSVTGICASTVQYEMASYGGQLENGAFASVSEVLGYDGAVVMEQGRGMTGLNKTEEQFKSSKVVNDDEEAKVRSPARTQGHLEKNSEEIYSKERKPNDSDENKNKNAEGREEKDFEKHTESDIRVGEKKDSVRKGKKHSDLCEEGKSDYDQRREDKDWVMGTEKKSGNDSEFDEVNREDRRYHGNQHLVGHDKQDERMDNPLSENQVVANRKVDKGEHQLRNEVVDESVQSGKNKFEQKEEVEEHLTEKSEQDKSKAEEELIKSALLGAQNDKTNSKETEEADKKTTSGARERKSGKGRRQQWMAW